MKIFISFLITVFFSASCSVIKKDKLIGTWGTVSTEKSTGSDSIKVHYFIEFPKDDGIYYLNQTVEGKWYFFIGYSLDSVHLETIKFISNDQFSIIFPDSVKKTMGISKNPEYCRVGKNIRPHKIILDLYNQVLPLGTTLDIDTLADKSIFYRCYLYGNREKSISARENEVKFYFDKEMKSLPKEEELNKYDSASGKIMNRYTWEYQSTKILLESYFNFRDTTGKDRSNDTDNLEVKIWQTIFNDQSVR
jgi:hypothetical protein